MAVTTPPPSKHIAIRTCFATKTRRPQSELVRLCANTNGQLHIDRNRTQPGRGAWVSPEFIGPEASDAEARERLAPLRSALRYRLRCPTLVVLAR
ncbi:MAG: DUF448 domain-containing protein [Alphaproteobacteria bacterium]|nr:DUF448 domain-containing protein [Alphaproteobacteria bacterium]